MQNFSTIFDDLAENGWSVTTDFLPQSVIKQLIEEQNLLFQSGKFKNAGIGKDSGKLINSEIRNDQILWFDENELFPAQQLFCNLMTEFRQFLNQNFFLGLNEFECHFAKYPIGSFYKRHLDQFKNSDSRVISFILYLNQDWLKTEEGFLRIYLPNETKDIYPEAGTFVCLKSSEIEHEVFPTKRERNSITGWMKK